MITLKEVPHGLTEINEYYGNPDRDGDFALDIDWADENIRRYEMPFPMRLSWNDTVTVTAFQAHRRVGAVIVDALEEILAYRGLEYLQEQDLDRYGGCWNFRKMVSYPALSTHSWGMAIDLNSHVAGYGADPSTQPEFIVAAFKKRGFNWGGDWPPKWTSDPMHFQGATGY